MLLGVDVMNDPLEVRRHVGYLAETSPLYTDMLVREYLDFIAEIRRIEPRIRSRRFNEVAERCGLSQVLDRPIGHLSRGYRQRIGIAQALIHEPDILILDEPTVGLDPNQIMAIRNLIREIGHEKTVILSTHILREVEAVCDRVLIIHQGRIVADDLPERLRRGNTVAALISGPREEMQAALSALPHVARVDIKALEAPLCQVKVATDGNEAVPAELFKLAAQKDWVMSELYREDASLEDVFQQLTEV